MNEAQNAGLEQWKVFQGLDGFPFRSRDGHVPYFRHDDPLHKQPRSVEEFRTLIFETTDEKGLAEYRRVMNLCARNRARFVSERSAYDKQLKGWRVFLVWAEFFLENPEEKYDDGVAQHVIS